MKAMEFRRYFPATVWIWSKRRAITLTAIALVAISVGLYTSLEFAYRFRANGVLALISSVHSNAEVNAAIVKLDESCRLARTESFGDEVVTIRSCAEEDFLHPYLEISAADSMNQVTGERSLSANIVLPRYKYIPINLEVTRLVSVSGKALKIVRRPNSDLPRGITLYAQAHSDFTVRINYKCAIPFARCAYERDLVSITTR